MKAKNWHFLRHAWSPMWGALSQKRIRLAALAVLELRGERDWRTWTIVKTIISVCKKRHRDKPGSSSSVNLTSVLSKALETMRSQNIWKNIDLIHEHCDSLKVRAPEFGRENAENKDGKSTGQSIMVMERWFQCGDMDWCVNKYIRGIKPSWLQTENSGTTGRQKALLVRVPNWAESALG